MMVIVSDKGQGFDPDILNSPIVEAGFGLLSLQERLRSIGGRMSVESAMGQGSKFSLTVPRKIIRSDKFEQVGEDPKSRITMHCKASDHSGGMRIILADDHRVIRQGLVSLIEGYPDIEVIAEATNGLEALELVRELNPDVVVMDISMPVMNGVDATRKIKSEYPNVRVIGLSMYEDAGIAEEMSETGAEVLIGKSASSTELLNAIYENDSHRVLDKP